MTYSPALECRLDIISALDVLADHAEAINRDAKGLILIVEAALMTGTESDIFDLIALPAIELIERAAARAEALEN